MFARDTLITRFVSICFGIHGAWLHRHFFLFAHRDISKALSHTFFCKRNQCDTKRLRNKNFRSQVLGTLVFWRGGRHSSLLLDNREPNIGLGALLLLLCRHGFMHLVHACQILWEMTCTTRSWSVQSTCIGCFHCCVTVIAIWFLFTGPIVFYSNAM